MEFLFSELLTDVIKYIMLFDEHFIMKEGKMITRFSKSVFRYNIVKLSINKKINILQYTTIY